MEVIRNTCGTEHERIRKYVITQIAKAGDSSMRLASSREMADEFGVAQTTVVRVLKDLVSAGYLTIKPGVGAFTKPNMLRIPNDAYCLGLLSGDGMQVFTCMSLWDIGAMFAKPLLKRSSHFQLQNCFLSGGNQEKELFRLGLDGFLCIQVTDSLLPAIQRIKESGVAVLSVAKQIPGVSSVCFDFDSDNYEVTKRMLAKGSKTFILVVQDGSDFPVADALRGVERALAEKGLHFDKNLLVVDSEKARSDFFKTLLKHRPDAIIFNANIKDYWAALDECKDTLCGCSLYSGIWSITDDMDYSGLIGRPVLSSAKPAVENLVEQLESPDTAPVFNGILKMEIVESSELEK